MKKIYRPILVTILMATVIYFIFSFIGMNIYWPIWQENPGHMGIEIMVRYFYLACVLITSIFIPSGWYDWKTKK